jgi:hypothetical protein
MVDINLWAEIKFLLECYQFIERTKRAAESKIEVVRFRIIPGDWGKAGSGWLIRLFLNRAARRGGGGRIHQFLWRCSHTVKCE